eukprot:m.15349 g.15349  ORF g.15349 m.15349 type:complete len:299 (-) comp10449_c0_seq1:70-966(-)
MSQPTFKRAKTRRGRKALAERAPKIHENPKSILYMNGTKCPQVVQEIFKELNMLTKPRSRIFSRKRELRPMEDEAALESLSNKMDISLFAVGTTNKKRPNTITFARMYDHRLFDMAELSVKDYKPMHKFKGVEKPMAGAKPCLLFNGHCWEQETDFCNLKSMFMDFFRGPVVEMVNLAGMDRVMSFTADEDRIVMTQYRILYKKSGSRLPLVELKECGPAIDFKLGRCRWASEELRKTAHRQPQQLRPKKKKNIEYNDLGDKLGRVHMDRQDFGQLQTRKMKALKRSAKEAHPEESSA